MDVQEAREVLGVKANASRKAVEKRYRKLALEHHPDRGGDEEQFKRIQHAYEVLTGRNERCQQDPEELAAVAVLGDCFVQVVKNLIDTRQDMTKCDLISKIRVGLDENIKQHTQAIEGSEDCKRRIEKIKDRFSAEGGEDLLTPMVESQIAKLSIAIAQHKLAITRAKAAKNLLARHKYTFDELKRLVNANQATPASGATWYSFGPSC